jgi:hypothetical protein
MTIWKIFTCAVLLLFEFGCAVYQIPPALTTEQRAELANSPYSQLVIGINTLPGKHDGKYLSESVINGFRTLFINSRLFKHVDLTSALTSPPDLVVDLRSGPFTFFCQTGEACATLMTLGIFPFQGNDNKKYSFTISNPRKSKTLDIEFTSIENLYVGSISCLLSLSSNWAMHPQEKERNYERFAYELLAKKNEILGLITER